MKFKISLPVVASENVAEALNVNAPRKRKFRETPASKALKKKRALEYKKNAAKARKEAKMYYKKNRLKIAKRRAKLEKMSPQKLSVRSSDNTVLAEQSVSKDIVVGQFKSYLTALKKEAPKFAKILSSAKVRYLANANMVHILTKNPNKFIPRINLEFTVENGGKATLLLEIYTYSMAGAPLLIDSDLLLFNQTRKTPEYLAAATAKALKPALAKKMKELEAVEQLVKSLKQHFKTYG